MHSRIFQLSTEPIKKEDYITGDTIIHDTGFIGYVADYVSEEVDRKEDIKWLLESITPYGAIYDEKEECLIFPKGFKERYFEKKFAALKEIVQEMSLEDFANDSLLAYKLKSTIIDRFSFYIYEDYYEPIDDFIRNLEVDTKYYIGGILDYHA